MSRTFKDRPRILSYDPISVYKVGPGGELLPGPKFVGKDAENIRVLIHQASIVDPESNTIQFNYQGRLYQFDLYDRRNSSKSAEAMFDDVREKRASRH